MKNSKLLWALAIITPWIAVIALTAVLITGNIAKNTTPASTTPAVASTAEPVIVPTSASEPISEPTASVEQTTATVPTEPVTEPTNASSEPISEPTASVEPTTATVPTEPVTEPTNASSEPISEPTTVVEPTAPVEPSVPTSEPTAEPTEPTQEPTTESTQTPTEEPTTEPTHEPTAEPTTAATEPTTDPHTHSWDEGTVTKKATYKESGEITYTCIDCGATKKEVVEQLKVEFELVEQRVTKLDYTNYYCNLYLANGTKEYYSLYFSNHMHYLIPEHLSRQNQCLIYPETTGKISVEYYAKGEDGEYYRYISKRDYLEPGQEIFSQKPAEKEILTESKDYEGYVIISFYSSKGVDLNYQVKFDITWIARNSADELGLNFLTRD